jgi:hypothetical protein
MKKYQILLLLIATLTIFNIASPVPAARDDQTGECIKKVSVKTNTKPATTSGFFND